MKTIMVALSLIIAAFSGTIAQAADNKGKVLVVMSGVDYLTLKSGKRHPTGYFLSELTGPAQAIAAAGYDLVFVNPTGKEPAMDKTSDSAQWYKTEQDYQRAKAFINRAAGLKKPRRLDSFTDKELSAFSAVFVPGGHAPMEDLAKNSRLGRILAFFHNKGKPAAFICHGPAALLSSVGRGKWIYNGYKMTVFSTPEEKLQENDAALGGFVRFYAAEELSKAGGSVDAGAPWSSHAVRDRELITAQNPMSEGDFTPLLLEALAEQRTRKLNAAEFMDGQPLPESKMVKIFSIQASSAAYKTFYWGVKKDGQPEKDFHEWLASHVKATTAAFKETALTEYTAVYMDGMELAYQTWVSQDALNKAFETEAGRQLAKDVSEHMDALAFKKIYIPEERPVH
ncbi:MAG: type 1 glutamine amidotransferase domain-containing protein [Elusimicrobia bacterium]|nr:type 1 glutamine amidotransferase domain-containing protein [Elusimicrobiota bacterium]